MATITLSVDHPILGTGGTVTVTATPSASITDDITITPSGQGAAGLSAATLTFTASSTPQSTTFTPTSVGPVVLAMTDSAGNTLAGSPLTVSAGTSLGPVPPVSAIAPTPLFFEFINVSASGNNTIVPPQAGKRILVTGYVLSVGATATNVYFKSSGGSVLTSTHYLAANAADIKSYNPNGWFSTVVGEGLVLNLSGANPVGVDVQFLLF